MEEDYVDTITSPDYNSQLLRRFHEFREEEKFFDFTLKIGNTSLPVHKIILAGCSDYFNAMFSHGMKECQENEVELVSLSLSGVKRLLDFAYTGKLELSISRIPDVLAVATFLQITSAISLCEKFMMDNMSFDNGDDLVQLGVTYGLNKIASCHRNFILSEFMEFTESESFLKLDSKTLASYLKEDALSCPSEKYLLEMVIRWFNYDVGNRRNDLYEVLEKIRYTNDGWDTIEFAARLDNFTRDPQFNLLMEWCYSYQKEPLRQHLYTSSRTRPRSGEKTLLRVGGKVFSDERDVLVTSGDITFYNTITKRWCCCGMSGKEEFRSHHQLLNVNGFAFILGGICIIGDSDSEVISNEMKLLNPHVFSLWQMQGMLLERANFAAVYTPPTNPPGHGYIYAIGGVSEMGPLASVERFNLGKERWRFISHLDKALHSHAATTYNSQIYVCGGIEDGKVSNRLRTYNFHTDSWKELPPMMNARYGHTFTAVGKQLIACGGRPSLNSRRCLSSVEAFDLDLQQWQYLNPMRIDCCFMSASEFEGKLRILGGETSVGDPLDGIQELDPKTGDWKINGCLDEPVQNGAFITMTISQSLMETIHF